MTDHPLENIGLSIGNFKCFADETLGSFEMFKPINILIGRNNSGKSALIDAIEVLTSQGKFFDHNLHSRGQKKPIWRVSFSVKNKEIRDLLSRTVNFPLSRNFQEHDLLLEFDFSQNWKPRLTSGFNLEMLRQAAPQYNITVQQAEAAINHLENVFVSRTPQPAVRRVAAERSVNPETEASSESMTPNGTGVTNTVRAFILDYGIERREVQEKLKRELNEIYSGDAEFIEIGITRLPTGNYEIFLTEKEKGDIQLSQSGSSLQSIFIILCLLRLIPQRSTPKISYNNLVICIEEPENNLHPALLRRLLNFLSKQREEKQFTLVLTTHSPICIDWGARRSDTQIIHVKHEEGASRTSPSSSYLMKRAILDGLDVRASDLLQSNGIIWVEGPTDRIYIRKWIELMSEGELQEDVHYSIMFYGGKLLAHVRALPPSDPGEQISLLSINRNAAIIIDSDRKKTKKMPKPRLSINSTKRRIRDEIKYIGGFVWITEGREIENYIHPKILGHLSGQSLLNIDRYVSVSEHRHLNKYNKDKIRIAHGVADCSKREHLLHLDLEERMVELVECIKRWNDIK